MRIRVILFFQRTLASSLHKGTSCILRSPKLWTRLILFGQFDISRGCNSIHGLCHLSHHHHAPDQGYNYRIYPIFPWRYLELRGVRYYLYSSNTGYMASTNESQEDWQVGHVRRRYLVETVPWCFWSLGRNFKLFRVGQSSSSSR